MQLSFAKTEALNEIVRELCWLRLWVKPIRSCLRGPVAVSSFGRTSCSTLWVSLHCTYLPARLSSGSYQLSRTQSSTSRIASLPKDV